MTTTYRNRYDDDISFENVSDTEIRMSGYDPGMLRLGWSNKKKKEYNMVDPSGGPYITPGTDMGLFGFKGFYVVEIHPEEEYVTLKVRERV